LARKHNKTREPKSNSFISEHNCILAREYTRKREPESDGFW
jgi:hypothetical protein